MLTRWICLLCGYTRWVYFLVGIFLSWYISWLVYFLGPSLCLRYTPHSWPTPISWYNYCHGPMWIQIVVNHSDKKIAIIHYAFLYVKGHESRAEQVKPMPATSV